jgi:lantibiotic modifying enzyme
MRSLMGRPGEEWRIHDGSLCHGASGLLHVTATIAESSGDAYLLGCLDHLVGQVIKLFDPNTPFGFRYTDAHRRPVENRAGMLEGAAGIALALTHIATPAPNHAVPWDSALLLK